MKDKAAIEAHPLYPVFMAAIEQAMYGKGERHGGNVTPFLDQPWKHYADMHGRGFLTGQAAKKLEEAASTRNGDAFKMEVLGAIVYCGMSVIHEQGESNPESDWIEWGGGECPVPAGTPVMIRLRNGSEHGPFPALQVVAASGVDASSDFWIRDGHMFDIIAYRIVK